MKRYPRQGTASGVSEAPRTYNHDLVNNVYPLMGTTLPRARSLRSRHFPFLENSGWLSPTKFRKFAEFNLQICSLIRHRFSTGTEPLPPTGEIPQFEARAQLSP